MPEQPTSSPKGKKLLAVVRDVLRAKHRVASPCGTTPTALLRTLF